MRMMQVRKGIKRDCPRVDYKGNRWTAEQDLPASHTIYQDRCDGDEVLVQQVGVGVEYNAAKEHVSCTSCGRQWVAIKSLRSINRGDEILVSTTTPNSTESTLVIAWDGGGLKRDGQGPIQCGVVAFAEHKGKDTHLLSVAISLFQAQTAQEAEAAGAAAVVSSDGQHS